MYLTGMDDIEEIFELFERDRDSSRFRCLAIHSDLPFEEQLDAWAPAKSDELKVIVATNAAESSITLPDVDHVIDLGMQKQVQYDERHHQVPSDIDSTTI